MSKLTLGQHQEKFMRDLCKLLQKAFDLGYEVRQGEGERPLLMQEYYFKTGRSKTLRSNHGTKTAHDLHFTKDGKLCYPPELGTYWESLDPLNRWGGNFKSLHDAPHFERNVA